MRRIILIFMVILFTGAAAVLAQEQPPAEPATTAEEAQVLLDEAKSTLQEAQQLIIEAKQSAGEAANAYNVANGMFGLFEAMSGAVGLVVPFLAVVAGLVGFWRLESAGTELKEARERFERDVQQKEKELDDLRDELKSSIHLMREASSRASLALALLPLGERQYRAQDYTGALDTYIRALNLDPDNPIIHYRIGYVYTQSGELERAVGHLTRSLELDPEFSPSRATLGYVYRRMGDKLPMGVERDITYNKAEENFLSALRSNPKLIDEDGEAWWGALGGLYRRRGQIEQAIEAYRRGTEVTPHSSYPFSNLALLYVQTQNREHMLHTYKRVEQLAFGEVQADVDNYWAYADLLVSRLALGKVKDAEDILETTLNTAPSDSPYTLESLIDTLRRLAAALEPKERPPVEHVIMSIERFKQQRDAQA